MKRRGQFLVCLVAFAAVGLVALSAQVEAQTDTPTHTPTDTPTSTPSITPTATLTPTHTNTPTASPSRTPSETPTQSPTRTATTAKTATQTRTPTGVSKPESHSHVNVLELTMLGGDTDLPQHSQMCVASSYAPQDPLVCRGEIYYKRVGGVDHLMFRAPNGVVREITLVP